MYALLILCSVYGCCKYRPIFRQIDSLAFLPFEDIPEGFSYNRDNTAPDTEDLADYFVQTYVTGTFRRAGDPRDGLDGLAIVRMRRVPHRYPPALWNVHQPILDQEQITSWNNRFTHLGSYGCPSLWIMTDASKNEDAVACTH